MLLLLSMNILGDSFAITTLMIPHICANSSLMDNMMKECFFLLKANYGEFINDSAAKIQYFSYEFTYIGCLLNLKAFRQIVIKS